MKITASSETKLIELLHNLGIPAEAVLLSIDGKLVPETASARKGEEIEIIFYKHVPPFSSPQEPRGHWKKAKHSSSCKLCKSGPAIYLPYANQHLCKKHFTELFEKHPGEIP